MTVHEALVSAAGWCIQAEAKAPTDVTSTLQTMHQWSSKHDLESLLTMMDQSDTAGLKQIHQEATELVQQLEHQLQQVQEPLEVRQGASQLALL